MAVTELLLYASLMEVAVAVNHSSLHIALGQHRVQQEQSNNAGTVPVPAQSETNVLICGSFRQRALAFPIIALFSMKMVAVQE